MSLRDYPTLDTN